MKLENIKLTDFKNGIWPSVDKSNIQSLIDECNILANKGQPWSEPIGEIGSCTLGLKYDKFLWIYVSLENLEILVKKYRLENR